MEKKTEEGTYADWESTKPKILLSILFSNLFRSQNSFKLERDHIEPYSVRPLDVLKTSEFYLLWTSFFAVSMVNGFINNYFKTFGQIYIKSDQFLANTAIASQVFINLTFKCFLKVIFALRLPTVFAESSGEKSMTNLVSR